MRNEKLVIKIIEKCTKLNTLGQDSFFRFSGHVKEISVAVCKKIKRNNRKIRSNRGRGDVKWKT